ncbi:MAG: aminotransferase class I/II-fold pyridoxal phosphate-dependent enzyme [Alphaproteobacteria bacterium]
MAIPRLHLPFRVGEITSVLADLTVPGRAGGELTGEFERRFAGRFGRAEAVAFCRARTAFFHLLHCLDLPPGAEVAITALHVADFVNMIRLAGFKPVVIDLEPDGFGIDFDDLEAKTGPRTACVLATALSGHSLDMDRLTDFVARRGMVLIEDCSQAFSTGYRDRRAGSFGRAAIYSLSMLKSVCTLRGGMVVTDDADIALRLRQRAAAAGPASRLPLVAEAIKNAIIATATWRPLFSALVLPLLRLTSGGGGGRGGGRGRGGGGGRGDRFSRFQKSNKTVVLRQRMPSDLLQAFTWQQAALGLRQLATVDDRETCRIHLAERLRAAIHPDRGVTLPRLAEGGRNTWWLFPVLAEDPAGLKRFLAVRGIDSAEMLLSALSAEESFATFGFSAPNAERLRARTLFLPLHSAMTETDVDRVAAAIAAYQAGVSGSGDRGCSR